MGEARGWWERLECVREGLWPAEGGAGPEAGVGWSWGGDPFWPAGDCTLASSTGGPWCFLSRRPLRLGLHLGTTAGRERTGGRGRKYIQVRDQTAGGCRGSSGRVRPSIDRAAGRGRR